MSKVLDQRVQAAKDNDARYLESFDRHSAVARSRGWIDRRTARDLRRRSRAMYAELMSDLAATGCLDPGQEGRLNAWHIAVRCDLPPEICNVDWVTEGPCGHE